VGGPAPAIADVMGAAVAALVSLNGCSDLADVAGQRFDAALAEAPGCSSDAQCTVLFTECPLGCAHAVALHAVDAMHEHALSLVERYRVGCGDCAYDCDTPSPVACKRGRCGFIAQ
jgi:hypothetical protein